MICIALMSDEVKLIFTCSLAKATGSVSMVHWTQLHFIACLSAAFISGRVELLSLGPLRMGLHSVGKPSKFRTIETSRQSEFRL